MHILNELQSREHPPLEKFIREFYDKEKLHEIVIRIEKNKTSIMNDDKYYYGLTSEKEIGDMFELHFLTFSISKFAHWYLSFADSATIIRPDSLNMKLKILSITFLFDCCQIVFLIDSMKKIFDQRFFRLLSECSQRKVSASEFAEAIEELATHVANFSINEQDYNVLLRYFSFGLHRLKSYRVRFEQEKNAPSASN